MLTVDWCEHVALKVQHKLYNTSLILGISQLIQY